MDHHFLGRWSVFGLVFLSLWENLQSPINFPPLYKDLVHDSHCPPFA